MKPIVACGTSEGEKLFEGRFGDASYFYLYEITVRGFEPIEKIENITQESTGTGKSGEEQKAKTVSSLLKEKSTNVLLAHQMGPNLAKISKDFVTIISRDLDIETALNSVIEKLHLVEREWRKGDNRDYLVLE